jgi:hypothetical protein
LPEWCATLARLDDQVEAQAAARAQEQGRLVARDARAVGGDQQVGAQQLLVLGRELMKARRADLLAGVDHDGRVEAELAALLQHHLERRHVDRVLRLVVGGAAAVIAVAVLLQHPWALALGPLRLEAANDVAVAVGEHRRELLVLDARRHQEWPAALHRVVDHLVLVAEPGEAGADLVGQVGAQEGMRGEDLALGLDRDAARQIGDERPVVVVLGGACDGGFA